MQAEATSLDLQFVIDSWFELSPAMRAGISALIGVALLLLDIATPRKRLGVLGAIVMGGLAGGIATLFVSAIIDLFVKTYGVTGQATLVDRN